MNPSDMQARMEEAKRKKFERAKRHEAEMQRQKEEMETQEAEYQKKKVLAEAQYSSSKRTGPRGPGNNSRNASRRSSFASDCSDEPLRNSASDRISSPLGGSFNLKDSFSMKKCGPWVPTISGGVDLRERSDSLELLQRQLDETHSAWEADKEKNDDLPQLSPEVALQAAALAAEDGTNLDLDEVDVYSTMAIEQKEFVMKLKMEIRNQAEQYEDQLNQMEEQLNMAQEEEEKTKAAHAAQVKLYEGQTKELREEVEEVEELLEKSLMQRFSQSMKAKDLENAIGGCDQASLLQELEECKADRDELKGQVGELRGLLGDSMERVAEAATRGGKLLQRDLNRIMDAWQTTRS